MNIGISAFGTDRGKSGIGYYTMRLLKEFDRVAPESRFEVFVHREEAGIFVPTSGHMTAIPMGEHLRHPLANVLWHQVALPRWCRKRKYDVLFLPAGNRRLTLGAPCPTVGVIHDFSSIHVHGKYDRSRIFYITHVLPFLIRRLTRVITVSESSKRDIVEYAGVPDERISVVPEGVDHETFSPGPKSAAQSRIWDKYKIPSPYILYISRIEHPGKNHIRLIRAFELLKRESIPHRLVLAGSDWNGAAEVHEAARSSMYAQDIVFPGFIPGPDLVDFYRGSDVFVFPSLYEGFGLPILEAMACGVPVACSDISSLPEVAGDAALLFDPKSEEAIAGALKNLVCDETLRQEIADRGVHRSESFTWEVTAVRTLQILGEAAGTESDIKPVTAFRADKRS